MKPWKYADAARAAQARGWVFSRSDGSHRIFTKPGERRPIVIPYHSGNLPCIVQRNIMRQLRIRPDDL